MLGLMFLSHVRQATTAPPATTQLAQSAAVKLRNALPVRMLKALSNWALGRTARLPLTARAAAVGKRRARRQRQRVDRVGYGAAARRGRGAITDDEFFRRRAVGAVDREAFVRRLDGRWGRGDDLGHGFTLVFCGFWPLFFLSFLAQDWQQCLYVLSDQFLCPAEDLCARLGRQLREGALTSLDARGAARGLSTAAEEVTNKAGQDCCLWTSWNLARRRAACRASAPRSGARQPTGGGSR